MSKNYLAPPGGKPVFQNNPKFWDRKDSVALQILSIIFLTVLSLAVLVAIFIIIPLIFLWLIFAGIRASVSKRYRNRLQLEQDAWVSREEHYGNQNTVPPL